MIFPGIQDSHKKLLKLSGLRQDFLSLLYLSLPLFTTFYTLDRADWIDQIPASYYEVFGASISGYVVLRLLTSRKMSFIAGLVISLFSSLGQGTYFLEDTSVQAMGTILIFTIWWVTFLTIWLWAGKFSPMLVLAPSLLTLLVTLGFLPEKFVLMLVVFLIASAPALTYLHFQGSTYAIPGASPGLPLLILGIIFMSVLVVSASIIPSYESGIRPSFFKKFEDPLFNLIEKSSGLLASVPNRKDWPTFYLGAGLPFTGPVALNDDLIMIVKSPSPQKWRMRVYETYTATGWTRPDEETEGYRYRFLWVPEHSVGFGNHAEVPIEVRTFTSMNLMASAGEPLLAGASGYLELSPLPQFTMDLDSYQNSYLPDGIQKLREEIIRIGNSADEKADLIEEIWPKLHQQELNATTRIENFEDPLTVERFRDKPMVVAVQFNEFRAPPRSYRTTGAVSDVSGQLLRHYRGDTPRWINDRYLQLPPDFPDAVKTLAETISVDLTSNYDIAIAIQNHLRALPYRPEIVPPPPDMDGVHWFLTVQQVGFCQYYASAMITMLRTLGIPARLVTGFAPGEWDPDRKAWVVRARNYHAWPEVYIPNHGWVEFEPTPSTMQPSLQRLGPGFESSLFDPLENADTGPCVGEDLDPFAPCLTYTPDLEALGDLNDPLTGATDNIPEEVAEPLGIKIFNVTITRLIPWVLSTVVLALIILVAARFLLRTRKFLKKQSYPEKVFSSMSRWASLAGTGRFSAETASEFGARLGYIFPESLSSIRRIVEAYEIANYSEGKLLSDTQMVALRKSWMQMRWALILRAGSRLKPSNLFKFRKLEIRAGNL